jgi:tRNA threonylcarbamoyladenosine biosynthesis protein TsaB
MSVILNIDTVSEVALVNIARDGNVLFEETNENQNGHAAFLHPAIQSVLKRSGTPLNEVDAVAVSHGPGSYTGIRVGVASAKGLCYAAGKPLIVLNELEILAQDAISNHSEAMFYCPLIDARRMEVFTAVYDKNMQQLMPPSAMVLGQDSFQGFLEKGEIVFFGSGSVKWQQVCNNENSLYANILNKGLAVSFLSHKKYNMAEFASLAYSAPLYLKEFYDNANAR